MPTEEHFRKLERMYGRAPINEYFEPELTVGEGSTEVRLTVQRAFHHAAEGVHGAVYFKVLDDAAFFAVSSLVEDVFVLTVSFNVYFIRPMAAGNLRARGRVVHASRRLFIAEAEASDSEGRVVARGSGTFMRSKVALDQSIGYR